MAFISNISGFGLQLRLLSFPTFPAGFTITEFADDANPLDIQTLQVNDSAMGPNGDLIVWSTANPIKLSISVIENSDSDQNLSILLEANRVGKGKSSARDIITLSAVYPDNNIISFSQGIVVDGQPGTGLQSSGRLNTKTYNFVFANRDL